MIPPNCGSCKTRSQGKGKGKGTERKESKVSLGGMNRSSKFRLVGQDHKWLMNGDG